MKKLFIAIILMSLIFSMFSCSGENGKGYNADGNDENYAAGVMGERPLLTLESLSEYKKFVKNAKLPEDFVVYDDIKELGEFKEFVCLSEARKNDFSECMYTLYDEDAGEFVLYIDREPFYESEHTKNVITNVNAKNMRSLNSSEHGTYKNGDINYVYLNGKLSSIEWKSGEWYYTISSIDDLKEDISGTNISKLFNLDTSTAFISSIAKPEEIK